MPGYRDTRTSNLKCIAEKFVIIGSGREMNCRSYDNIFIINTRNGVSALVIVNTRTDFKIRLGIYISCSKCRPSFRYRRSNAGAIIAG